MGVVYRAQDLRSGEEVALKVLTRADAQQQQRMAREAQALMRLRHPHIVGVRDMGQVEGRGYLVLDLVRGDSLQRRIDRRGTLSEREAAATVRDVARAVAYAHENAVLHRDLKPSNILIDADGTPRLTDFGLAMLWDTAHTQLTRSGVSMGTPGFWAPEQAQGELEAIGPRTDVYGLGATLYAALTGYPPIQRASLLEVIIATREVEPGPISAERAVDPVLEKICSRCLKKDPRERYPTADALADALDDWLAGAPSAPRRTGAALAAVVVLGVVGAIALGGDPQPGAEEPLGRPRVSPAPASPAPPQAVAGDDFATRQRKQAEGWFERAKQRLANKDTGGALAALDRALEIAPTLHAARRQRADLHFRTGRHREASADYERLLAAGVEADAALLINLGRVRDELKDFARARAALERAVKLDPRSAEAWYQLGRVRQGLRAWGGALAAYEKAVELEPKRTWAHFGRGLMLRMLRRHSEALAALELAIKGAPKAAEMWFELGLVRIRLEQWKRAIADLDRSLNLNPRQARAYHERGFARESLRQDTQAIADYTESLRRDPKYLRSYRGRGLCRRRTGEYREAIADFSKALELGDTKASTWRHRGYCRYKLELFGLAEDDLRKALALDPKDGWAHNDLGLVLQARKKHREAVESFTRALRIFPRSARIHRNRSLSSQALGDVEGMAADMERAERLDPRKSVALRGVLGRRAKRVQLWVTKLGFKTKVTAVDGETLGRLSRLYGVAAPEKTLGATRRVLFLAPHTLSGSQVAGVYLFECREEASAGRWIAGLRGFQRRHETRVAGKAAVETPFRRGKLVGHTSEWQFRGIRFRNVYARRGAVSVVVQFGALDLKPTVNDFVELAERIVGLWNKKPKNKRKKKKKN